MKQTVEPVSIVPLHQWQSWPGSIMSSCSPSVSPRPRERDISGTPGGSFITSGTNVHLGGRVTWSEFDGHGLARKWRTHMLILTKFSYKCPQEENDEVMTFYIQKVKSPLHCDIIMLCKITFLSIIHGHNSGTEGEIATIFHTKLVTLILGAHLETAEMAEIIFCCCAENTSTTSSFGFADIEL